MGSHTCGPFGKPKMYCEIVFDMPATRLPTRG